MSEANISKEQMLAFYRMMVRIRSFEEKAADCFMKGKLAGNIHLSIGQEAVATGTMAAIEKTDYITSTHRGHGHCLAKGGDAKLMMAELFGKKTGYCKGKGGSMHIAEMGELNILGANGIVGAGIPIATGSALASKVTNDGAVTVCMFGDSASNQGTFHEALNMAATWKLPVVYVCENNGYGVSTAIGRVTNTDCLSVRAKAYDIPGITVDGTDPEVVYTAVKEAADRARRGEGPSLVECKTFRYQGHYCGDPAVYRPKEYMEEALTKDCIEKMGRKLTELGYSAQELEKIKAEAETEMQGAVDFAENSEYPDVCEATTEVYANDNERCVAR
ncbi:MAG: thiamine pyrophosphate-dependent dehydrogenase E1 component subunit alpha [Clostridiales bacterium]|nr:thiamine pyrophosphate-dependent dehydrogenase E1 component subunit alpha [Clostridiales bacterium]